VEDYARAVVSFLDAVGVSKTSIVGHHTGASIAVEVAVTRPERVDKLVLSGCPLYEPGVPEKLLQDDRFQPMVAKDDGSHIIKMWQVAKGYSPASRPEVLTKVVANNLRIGAQAEDGHHAAFKYRPQERLPLLDCPTLVMSGTRDVFIKKLDAAKNLIRRSRAKVLEGGGVWVGFEMPEEFAAAVFEFLEHPGV
jgi:pimeloyl-ACP methyl ester carboxylesterase